MPNSDNYRRNYRDEYDKYHGTPEQRRKNDSRKKARRLMEAAGKVRKGDGKDIDHKNGNPLQSHKSNLRVTSKRVNRSFPRNKNAGKK